MASSDGQDRSVGGKLRPPGVMVWALRRLDRRSTASGREPFDALELGVVAALVPVLVPMTKSERDQVDERAARARVNDLEEALQSLPSEALADVRATLVWLDTAPWRLGPRRARLTALAPGELSQFVRAWSISRDPDVRARWEVLRSLFIHVLWPCDGED